MVKLLKMFAVGTLVVVPSFAEVKPLISFDGGFAKAVGGSLLDWRPGWNVAGNFMARFGKPFAFGARASLTRFTRDSSVVEDAGSTQRPRSFEKAFTVVQGYGVLRPIYEINKEMLLFLQAGGGVDIVIERTKEIQQWNTTATSTNEVFYGIQFGAGLNPSFFELGFLYDIVFRPGGNLKWLTLFAGIKLHY